jgi:hypothetical protein
LSALSSRRRNNLLNVKKSNKRIFLYVVSDIVLCTAAEVTRSETQYQQLPVTTTALEQNWAGSVRITQRRWAFM